MRLRMNLKAKIWICLIVTSIAEVTQSQLPEHNHHYYKLKTTRDFWQNADDICRDEGGYMISLNDQDEITYFENNLYVDSVVNDSSIWIGLRSQRCNSNACWDWDWEDGTGLSSSNWANSYPAAGSYRHYVTVSRNNKRWRNERSRIAHGGTEDKRKYFCEYVDACFKTSKPCEYGGICSSRGEFHQEFDCNCNGTGYTGDRCQTDIDECQSNPCTNGACINEINQYTCNCTGTGYTGDNCEMNIDECADNTHSCQNGTCADANGTYTCDCAIDFTGQFCETQINDCESQPCQNNGTCVDGIKTFSCECTEYFSGALCQTDINECQVPDFCNHGECENLHGGFNCSCYHGYQGERCNEDIDECLNSSLVCGWASCTNSPGHYSCDCPDGYHGYNCSYDVNECVHDDACNNHGTCNNTMGNYTCTCDVAHTGLRCENSLGEDPGKTGDGLSSLWIAFIVGAISASITVTILIGLIMDDRIYQRRVKQRKRKNDTDDFTGNGIELTVK